MFHFEVDDEAAVLATPRTARGGNGDGATEDFKVGDKIYDGEKFTGVVKYIGKVDKFAGDWLGVEWDVPSRGKHNGALNEIDYFQCSIPNAGSFVRLHKVKKVRTIKAALDLRYGHDEALFNALKSIEDRLERKKISYSQLRTLNLSSKGIEDSHKEVEEICRLCPNVEALELADNLITSWNFIGSLCAGFSKLSRLDMSKNPMTSITEEEVCNHKTSFGKVDHVVLGSVSYDWDAVLRVSAMFPNLKNLQVPFNNITIIKPPTQTLMNVTSLDLEGNQINCWNEVLKLTVLERLEYLNLCGNGLKSIRFPSEPNKVHTETTSCFPNLRVLNLTENSIDDWISIGELNKLKKLRELRIDLNPLLNKDIRTSNRQMIIARIGTIQKLEGVEILRQERRDAEIDYVKKFAPQWEAEKDSFRFAAENPRYRELVEKWGESDVNDNANTQKTMKSSLIGVTFVSEKSEDHKPCTKKVMPTMTVQKLKAFVQRVFRETILPSKITLISARNPGIQFDLIEDFLDLASYSIEEGDTLKAFWT